LNLLIHSFKMPLNATEMKKTWGEEKIAFLYDLFYLFKRSL